MAENYVEIHYAKIMDTEVNLYDLAPNETAEKGFEFLAEVFGGLGQQEGARDRTYTRRGIIDKIIADTGGIVKLTHMRLGSYANPKDDDVAFSLVPILLDGARRFVEDPKNKSLVSQIEDDDAWRLGKSNGTFDFIHQYIADYIAKKEGVYE